MITFSCQQCATHFKVAERFAGKPARCKKCGQTMRVPEAPAAVAAVAASGLFRMGAVTADSPTAPQQGATTRERTGMSSLRLAPIPSLDDLQPVKPKRERLWEDDDGKEYELDKPIATPAMKPTPQFPPTKRRIFWGRGGIAETLMVLLRKFSHFAYLVSIPFLLLMLVAIILKQRELAILAGIVVILLNIVRLVTEGIVLFSLAFKNGPLQGVLFFIPPFTFYYLNQRGKVLKDALTRFLGPALPIIGVVLLFIIVPRLRGGNDAQDTTLGEQVRENIRAVDEQIRQRSPTSEAEPN